MNAFNEKSNRMKTAYPWVIYYRKLCCLFNPDPDIEIQYNNGEKYPAIRIYVKSIDKANALCRLLPEEKDFGNVTLKIIIVPPSTDDVSKADLIACAFRDNPVFEGVKTLSTPGGTDYFAMFIKEVVQYDADDISDWYRQQSTLYQDIAKEILGEEENLHYCTDKYEEPRKGWKSDKHLF